MFCDRCQLFWDEVFRKAHIPEKLEGLQQIIWTPHRILLHNSLDELKESSDLRCRICRLVYCSLSEYDLEALLDWRNDKTRVFLGLDTASGSLPITLQADFRGGMILGPKTLIASSSSGLGAEKYSSQSIEEFATMLDESVRLDNNHTGSDGALQLASYWIKTCTKTHKKCRPQDSGQSSSFVPTRLLDVSNSEVRLIETKSEIGETGDRSYIALSHCWGSFPIIRTLKENYRQHTEAVPWENLSKTFREAIHTTRKLGFRFIWIDSMCIVQDDNDDWAAEAATMCDVYQHSVFTIAAAHAPDGEIGCFRDRDGLLTLPFCVDIPAKTKSVMPIKLHFTTYGRLQTKDLGGGDPALYGRAWVLQEQLLSPRLLIFDGDQLKWECLTLHGSEGSPTSGTTRYTQSYKFVRSAVMGGHDFFHDANDSKETSQSSSDFWLRMKLDMWCAIIMDYTHRGMTKPSDRLAALAGIAQALSRYTKHDYKAGLWSMNLFIGLLWSLPHHEKYLMSATTNFNVKSNEHIRHEPIIAPSWSWASVTAPVWYAENIAITIDRVCEVEDVQVPGSIDRQARHVPIHGHIRRGYVNAVYPYTIREAVAKIPEMTAPAPAGRMGLENVTFQDRCFHPNEFFLFSKQHPDPKGSFDTTSLRRKGSFSFVRGTFRPDEIIEPTQEITFLAIGQRHRSAQISTPLSSTKPHDPIQVHTLALVPTGDEKGTYRRVGLAVWDDCAWYGYLCGWKHDLTRRITAPKEWAGGFHVGEYIWEEAYRKLWWDDMEFYKCTERVGGDGLEGRWKHEHEYQSERLPDWRMYKAGTLVEEKTVVIV